MSVTVWCFLKPEAEKWYHVGGLPWSVKFADRSERDWLAGTQHTESEKTLGFRAIHAVLFTYSVEVHFFTVLIFIVLTLAKDCLKISFIYQ